jgi:L-Ala-D/L-Glu epimerase
MSSHCSGETLVSVSMRLNIEAWPLAAPFRITGHTFNSADVLVVTLECEGLCGQGEAMGVYYRSETPTSMCRQLEAIRSDIEGGIGREAIQRLLGPGGARNALDCAFWDLESKLLDQPVWRLAGLNAVKPITTNYGCDASTPEVMASTALGFKDATSIKLKLIGDLLDEERVKAVRAVRPTVKLSVDANQGFTIAHPHRLIPTLIDARIELIEQPFPVSKEAWLDDIDVPIAVAADESVQSIDDIDAVAQRFDVINIKLDKCGGLTQALEMARECGRQELVPMVGSMMGTSLAMAAGFVVAQLCKIVDLDAPLFLSHDRVPPVTYKEGKLGLSPGAWGNPLGTFLGA